MSRRSFAWRVALFLGTFALLLFALDQLVPDARKQLSNASAGWLVAGLCFELLLVVTYAVLFRIVFARPPHDLGQRTSSEISLAQLGGFAITPAGVGGAAVGWWALRRNGMPWRTIFVRVITHGLLLNIPFLLAGIAFGVAALTGVLPGHARRVVELAPIVLAAAAVLLFALAWRAARSPRFAGESRWRTRLRQAFQLAGAGNVVASLWAIPDEATARLTGLFYDRAAGGMSRSAALAEAQRETIRQRRKDKSAAHPYLWAAFTITGRD
jgi:uncharacterized membrane protein YbhN (UPF0104 family)